MAASRLATLAPAGYGPGGGGLDGGEQVLGAFAVLARLDHQQKRVAKASHQPVTNLDTNMDQCVRHDASFLVPPAATFAWSRPKMRVPRLETGQAYGDSPLAKVSAS